VRSGWENWSKKRLKSLDKSTNFNDSFKYYSMSNLRVVKLSNIRFDFVHSLLIFFLTSKVLFFVKFCLFSGILIALSESSLDLSKHLPAQVINSFLRAFIDSIT